MTPHHRPVEILDQTPLPHVQQALVRRKPETTRPVPRHVKHFVAGHAGYAYKTIVVRQIRQAAVREHPDSTTVILEERLRAVMRQSTALVEDRGVSVLPPGQAILGANPDAPIRGREHRQRCVAGEALFRGQRSYGELSKPVESSRGGDPDIAFTILEETAADIARKPIGFREYVRPAVVCVDKPTLASADPETSFAVPKEFVGIDIAIGEQAIASGRIPNGMGFESDTADLQESSAAHPDQHMSVVDPSEIADPHPRRLIAPGRSGFPSHDSRFSAGPESTCTVLEQTPHEFAEDPALPITLRVAAPDGAQLARRSIRRLAHSAGPEIGRAHV